MEETIQELLEFIRKSPSCFHVVENIRRELLKAGFCQLNEKDEWNLLRGRDYFVTRNGSSVIAFRIPEKDFLGFHMTASHSDSPAFRIKESPEIHVEGQYVKLNTEKYGGMIMETWFDRPLSAAGRIIIEETGKIRERLVNLDRDLFIIPNLAIHMTKGEAAQRNPQKDLLPFLGCTQEKQAFLKLLARETGVKKEQILSYDLFLYQRTAGTVLGLNKELVASAKLDDLECVFASLKAFLQEKSADYMNMCCIFDNEEVGSSTKQGAGSTFGADILKRIMAGLGKTQEDYFRAVANSFLISADNAHAVHPNMAEKTDPSNRPYLNQGLVLKYHASQKYTTDARSAALVKYLCKKEKIPYQVFFNRSDLPGGSTLGNIFMGQVSMQAADIGLPQLAMHSAYETAGTKDLESMIRFLKAFYAMGEEVEM